MQRRLPSQVLHQQKQPAAPVREGGLGFGEEPAEAAENGKCLPAAAAGGARPGDVERRPAGRAGEQWCQQVESFQDAAARLWAETNSAMRE